MHNETPARERAPVNFQVAKSSLGGASERTGGTNERDWIFFLRHHLLKTLFRDPLSKNKQCGRLLIYAAMKERLGISRYYVRMLRGRFNVSRCFIRPVLIPKVIVSNNIVCRVVNIVLPVADLPSKQCQSVELFKNCVNLCLEPSHVTD